jgi:hypothetical protein
MNDKMKPALIGGVILGILSAIPFVNIPNICCCAWAIVGGIIAANIYIKSSPAPVRPGDGAVLGAIAGAIGGVINLIVGVPLQLAFGNVAGAVLTNIIASQNPEQAEQMRMQMAASGASVGSAIFFGIIALICLTIFAAVGGLIGVAIFEKRKGVAGAPPPPPPPAGGYGGPGM